MKKLAIIGSGDLGIQIAHYASSNMGYKVVGFFDDYAKKGSVVNGISVLGKLSEIKTIYSNSVFDEIVIGIGYKQQG